MSNENKPISCLGCCNGNDIPTNEECASCGGQWRYLQCISEGLQASGGNSAEAFVSDENDVTAEIHKASLGLERIKHTWGNSPQRRVGLTRVPEDVEKEINEAAKINASKKYGDLIGTSQPRFKGYISGATEWYAKGRNAEKIKTSELAHEIERFKILIKIADELITNENAKEDWKNAKRTRVM